MCPAAISEIQTRILDLRRFGSRPYLSTLAHNGPINVFVDAGIVVVGLVFYGPKKTSH